jgi:hypothetical protein
MHEPALVAALVTDIDRNRQEDLLRGNVKARRLKR